MLYVFVKNLIYSFINNPLMSSDQESHRVKYALNPMAKDRKQMGNIPL